MVPHDVGPIHMAKISKGRMQLRLFIQIFKTDHPNGGTMGLALMIFIIFCINSEEHLMQISGSAATGTDSNTRCQLIQVQESNNFLQYPIDCRPGQLEDR